VLSTGGALSVQGTIGNTSLPLQSVALTSAGDLTNVNVNLPFSNAISLVTSAGSIYGTSTTSPFILAYSTVTAHATNNVSIEYTGSGVLTLSGTNSAGSAAGNTFNLVADLSSITQSSAADTVSGG